MFYLEYQKSNGYVIAVHDVVPNAIDDNGIAKSDNFVPGDEFEYFIIINEVDENGILISASSIRQAPPATYILKELATVKKEKAELEMIVADLLVEKLGVV
ncbi:MAG: hypothetical protein ACOWWO_11955 [Peptococcaceae bacterium]